MPRQDAVEALLRLRGMAQGKSAMCERTAAAHAKIADGCPSMHRSTGRAAAYEIMANEIHAALLSLFVDGPVPAFEARLSAHLKRRSEAPGGSLHQELESAWAGDMNDIWAAMSELERRVVDLRHADGWAK